MASGKTSIWATDDNGHNQKRPVSGQSYQDFSYKIFAYHAENKGMFKKFTPCRLCSDLVGQSPMMPRHSGLAPVEYKSADSLARPAYYYVCDICGSILGRSKWPASIGAAWTMAAAPSYHENLTSYFGSATGRSIHRIA